MLCDFLHIVNIYNSITIQLNNQKYIQHLL